MFDIITKTMSLHMPGYIQDKTYVDLHYLDSKQYTI